MTQPHPHPLDTGLFDRITAAIAADEAAIPEWLRTYEPVHDCPCAQCIKYRNEVEDRSTPLVYGKVYWRNHYMIVCTNCGNKRCPHANWHANGCTGSNAPGQAGSAY